MKPFHLLFVVPNLEKVRNFYVNILGCEVGRDTGKWIDIIFFGHQITIHQEREGITAKAIDHFGPVLEKEEWLKISDTLSSSNIPLKCNQL